VNEEVPDRQPVQIVQTAPDQTINLPMGQPVALNKGLLQALVLPMVQRVVRKVCKRVYCDINIRGSFALELYKDILIVNLSHSDPLYFY
jgi:hypothetical protein